MTTNLLTSLKSRTSSTKEKYSLNEELTIMSLLNQGFTYKQISVVTGRTSNSLIYKVRNLKTNNSIEDLFKKHGEEYVSDEDINERIESYKDSLEQKEIDKAS